MNRNYLCNLILSLAMLLAVTCTSVSAATFSDISDHWAQDYIEDVVSQGLINGYTDGTFHPDEETTYCQALLLCSRIADWDDDVVEAIYDKWYDDVAACLPESMVSWAASELTMCLEMGVITLDELEALCDDDTISDSIPREALAFYLTRALQLDELAENIASTAMSFNDYSSITTDYLPYVYLLNYYEIIQGDTQGYFNPQASVTRGTIATMLSRAMDLIEDKGILFELADYNDYDSWFGGVITSASTSSATGITTLTITSDAAGDKAVSIPASASIYRFNLLTNHSALTVDSYVRVNYNSSGIITSALIGDATTTQEGTIISIAQDSIRIWTGSGYESYAINGFTAVSVGSYVGDASLIDVTEDYVSAQCTVNKMNQLTDLVLLGGSQVVEGIFYKYSSSTLQITGLDGILYTYDVSSDVALSVDGSAVTTLSSSRAGSYITIYVDNTTGAVTTAVVDTTVTMLQGSIKTLSASADPRTLTIKDLSTSVSTKYTVSDDAVFYQDGEEVSMSSLKTTYFLTAMFNGDTDDEIIYVWAIDETYYASGTLLAIDYDVPTSLELLLDDGTTATYYIDVSDMPTIERDGDESALSKLRSGDLLDLEIEYNLVSEITAISQEADNTGTLLSISKTTSGTYINVEFDDGSSDAYILSTTVTILQDDTDLSANDLEVGMNISFLVAGETVYYIEVIEEDATSLSILTAKLISIDSDDFFYVTLDGDSSTLLTIDIDDAVFRNTSGSSVTLSSFESGDYIQLYGAYSGSIFYATMVIYLY